MRNTSANSAQTFMPILRAVFEAEQGTSNGPVCHVLCDVNSTQYYYYCLTNNYKQTKHNTIQVPVKSTT